LANFLMNDIHLDNPPLEGPSTCREDQPGMGTFAEARRCDSRQPRSLFA
jgi:hypothetical protein